jgi:hypothetical protein
VSQKHPCATAVATLYPPPNRDVMKKASLVFFLHLSAKEIGDIPRHYLSVLNEHLIYTTVGIMGGYQGTLAGDVANP